MSLLVVGLNHRTAPTSVLERATVGPDDAEKLLHDLLQGEHVAEAVLVSTCNRVEVFAETATHGGRWRKRRWSSGRTSSIATLLASHFERTTSVEDCVLRATSATARSCSTT